MDYEVLCNRELQRRFNVSIDNVNKMRKRKFHLQSAHGAIWFSKVPTDPNSVICMHMLVTSEDCFWTIKDELYSKAFSKYGFDVNVFKTDDSALVKYSAHTWFDLYQLLNRLPGYMPTGKTTWISFNAQYYENAHEFIKHIHTGSGDLSWCCYANDRSAKVLREIKSAIFSFA